MKSSQTANEWISSVSPESTAKVDINAISSIIAVAIHVTYLASRLCASICLDVSTLGTGKAAFAKAVRNLDPRLTFASLITPIVYSTSKASMGRAAPSASNQDDLYRPRFAQSGIDNIS